MILGLATSLDSIKGPDSADPAELIDEMGDSHEKVVKPSQMNFLEDIVAPVLNWKLDAESG